MAANTGYSDTAPWRAAAAGEHAAFGQLFDRHAGAVYNYLYRRTADWSAAEDLTAAVFLQAWRRRGEVIFDRDSARSAGRRAGSRRLGRHRQLATAQGTAAPRQRPS